MPQPSFTAHCRRSADADAYLHQARHIPALLFFAFLILTIQMAPVLGETIPPGNQEWWRKCTAIRDDRERLACFDSSAPATALAPPRQENRPVATVAPVAPASENLAIRPAASSQTSRFRVSLGYGMGIAGHDGSFVVQHGTLQSLSGFGNSGQTYFVQGWMSNWPGENWAIGLEYLHLQNGGRINLDLPRGLSILTDPVTANLHAEVLGDMGFANIAYQPDIALPLRSYIGMGLGIGEGAGHFALQLHNDFLGTVTSVSNGRSMFGGLQGFMGLDIPISGPYYLGLQGKAVWVTGHPVGIDQRYLDFIFGISIGREF